MRKFEFRVWDGEKYLYSDSLTYIGLELKPKNYQVFSRLSTFFSIGITSSKNGNVDNFIIQQHTGFKDKYNKDIYEGDICFADGQRRVIIFEEGMFGYKTTLGMHCILIPVLMEVIGNIFEQAWMLEAYNLKV